MARVRVRQPDGSLARGTRGGAALTAQTQAAACDCCEPPDDCCTGVVARLPDGPPSRTAILSFSATEQRPGATYTVQSSVSVQGEPGQPGDPGALARWDVINCREWSMAEDRNLGPGVGTATVTGPNAASAVNRVAQCTIRSLRPGWSSIAAQNVTVSSSNSNGQQVYSANYSIAWWFNGTTGQGFAIIRREVFAFAGQGGVNLPQEWAVAQYCVPVLVTPGVGGSLFFQASGSVELPAIPGSAGTASAFVTVSASMSVDFGYDLCPGRTLPASQTVDCSDPFVVECLDANLRPIDPRCCDPVNPLPPGDPRCTDVGVGAGCCLNLATQPYFIADDAYAIVLLYWFYRRIAFFTNPNRWVADEVYVGEATLRVNLPRLGSPECAFRTSSAVLAGGVNQSGDRFSQRWLNFGTEQNPDWRPENRNFISEFTFGQTAAARLRHRIFTTATGSSNAHFDASVTTPSGATGCTRGPQTRQVVGWTLQCSRAQWPSSSSGFYTQFVMRDSRPGLPVDGSIQGVQSDGEVNAAVALYRYGQCPVPPGALTLPGSGAEGGALRLATLDEQRRVLLGDPSRPLLSDAETPGLSAAMLAHGAEGRAAQRVARGRGKARRFADRYLLRSPSRSPGAPVTPGVPLDPIVLAALQRQLGGCRGCGDPGVEP